MAANKQFWEAVKPFFSKKNFHSDYHILINDKNNIVDDETKPKVELFNTFFLNKCSRKYNGGISHYFKEFL